MIVAGSSPGMEGLRMIRTGKQYIESIRDGREVYINGEQVPEVLSRSRRIMEWQ